MTEYFFFQKWNTRLGLVCVWLTNQQMRGREWGCRVHHCAVPSFEPTSVDPWHLFGIPVLKHLELEQMNSP